MSASSTPTSCRAPPTVRPTWHDDCMTPRYVPHFNQMPEDDVRAFVAAVGVAQLVTVAGDGTPDATLLPVLWDGDRLVGHFARANRHWQRIADGTPALAVVTGPDAYVSPGWYASK